MHKRLSILAAAVLICGIAAADEPKAAATWELKPSEIAPGLKTANKLEPAAGGLPERLVIGAPIRFERYSLQQHLVEGWYRVTFRLVPDRPARPDDSLSFALWNPYGSPGAFRFTTRIIPAEFGPGGKLVEVPRMMHVGPANGNLGMLLESNWQGLGIAGIRFDPVSDVAFVESIRPSAWFTGQLKKERPPSGFSTAARRLQSCVSGSIWSPDSAPLQSSMTPKSKSLPRKATRHKASKSRSRRKRNTATNSAPCSAVPARMVKSSETSATGST